MACTQMNCSKNGTTSAADLTDDLIIEILSLLPVKSVCRFKCVSRLWYLLISQHRKKLPQTISGFFYPMHRYNNEDGLIGFPTFDGISGDQKQLFPDSSLPFLTGYRQILPKDCCNGLIFCLCWKDSPIDEADYVVCNPATEEWVVLPDAGHRSDALEYRLGFDGAMSPHFHVFQILEGDEDYGYISGVNIYSSETGAWSYKENGWGDNEIQIVEMRGVFFNGMMHLLTCEFKILAVDTEGKTWRTISLLETMCVGNICLGPLAFIGQSQGRLYFINMRDNDSSKLSVWILEDYNGNEWIFKYNISTSQLFGELFGEKDHMLQRDYADLLFQRDYALIAIHPECNLIFFVWRCEDVLLSYDMDRGKVCVICSLKYHSYDTFPPYLPYVPCFSRIGRPRVEA
ncbi:hypothetical protein VPH35_035044 [Triticum aestivum]|uniref:F-box protein At5g07610 n=1 Tax=Triticum aestivum TaxID=4565 RepID=UPI0008455372|nr:F-box protein At5g07610-like [Triticum aestivum]